MIEMLACLTLPMIVVIIGNAIIRSRIKPNLDSDTECCYKILNMTVTNNDLSSFNDVINNLDDELSKLGIKLHMDMSGYLTDTIRYF